MKPLDKDDRKDMRELSAMLLRARKPADQDAVYEAMREILLQPAGRLVSLIKVNDTAEQAQRRITRAFKKGR